MAISRILSGIGITAVLVFKCPGADPGAGIQVDGLVNQGVYADQITFRIPSQTGYETSASLDSITVPVDAWLGVTDANYHELRVRRSALASSQTVETNLAFIVYASDRGNTEWGLPRFTPPPPINSSAGETAGLRLVMVAPAAFPTGQRLPVVLRLERPDGYPAWLNGRGVLTGTSATIQLRRGFGSGRLPAVSVQSTQTLTAAVHSLSAQRSITFQASPPWTAWSGKVSETKSWPSRSFLHLTNEVEIAAGAALEIGAGSIVLLDAGVNLVVQGRFSARGTLDEPVVFMPWDEARPWGGFIAQTNTASIELTGAILTGGGGDPLYFQNHFAYTHRLEQAVLLLHHGAHAALTNTFLIFNSGQAGNGWDSFLTLDQCVIQHCLTGGEFEGGSVEIIRSGLIEFPAETDQFADADEDGLYLGGGPHTIRDSLIGWTRDDGIDAGAGAAGLVTISNCWFEACYHEALAWSGPYRLAQMDQTVIVNCGQGIEAGYGMSPDSPIIHAQRILATGCAVGLRFGDNYNWGYPGFLQVTNSLILYNQRDVWGMTWQDWTWRTNQMDIRGNFLSAPNLMHPTNQVWNPSADANRLAPFTPGPPGVLVGLGLALRSGTADATQFHDSVPVALSSFSTRVVQVDYAMDQVSGATRRGTLQFLPGEMLKPIPFDPSVDRKNWIRLRLDNPSGAEFTGLQQVFFKPEADLKPNTLGLLRAPSGMVVYWVEAGWSLDWALGPAGPWQAIPGAISPYAVAPAAAPQYFRLHR